MNFALSNRNKGSIKISVSCRKQRADFFLTETKIEAPDSLRSLASAGRTNRRIEKHAFLSRLEWVSSECFLRLSAVSNRRVSRLASVLPGASAQADAGVARWSS